MFSVEISLGHIANKKLLGTTKVFKSVAVYQNTSEIGVGTCQKHLLFIFVLEQICISFHNILLRFCNV